MILNVDQSLELVSICILGINVIAINAGIILANPIKLTTTTDQSKPIRYSQDSRSLPSEIIRSIALLNDYCVILLSFLI